MGRRFHKDSCGPPTEEGRAVELRREKGNEKDENAIQVVSLHTCPLVLGHVPRQVACHLAPLLDRGSLVQGTVSGRPERSHGALPIRLHLHTTGSPPPEWLAAQQAAEDGGPYLHNFIYLLTTVAARDSHLLEPDEVAHLGESLLPPCRLQAAR